MGIEYSTTRSVTSEQFVDLLRRSTLAERRPVDDARAIAAMLQHTNLLATAWDGERLIGVARSLTDFEYCCYLSDLAVDADYQRNGIGKRLIAATQGRLGTHAKIILLAAPKAQSYYPRVGFDAHPSAWILPANRPLR